MRFKFAILNVLARCPGGRATLDDVRREVRVIIASGDQTEQLNRFSALGDIDIFQSGLVLRDDAGLQITDAGLSLLHSLESSSRSSVSFSSGPPIRSTDDILSTEERLRIFDLELGVPDNDVQDEESGALAIESPNAASPTVAVDPLERTNFNFSKPGHKSPGLAGLIAGKTQFLLDAGRRYFTRHTSPALNGRNERLVRRVGNAAFALLSLLLAVACVAAAIAFGQIQSLKSDIAALRRELVPAKERIARLEQAEKAKRDLDQQEEAQNKSDSGKSKEVRADQTALNLSREEIQLIRDYIKPAPTAGAALPAINVGDTVGGATIPLPSQLTEKVPRLLGARFTTRNGAIIIVKRDSRQADVVLGPN